MLLEKLQLHYWKHLPGEYTVEFQPGLNVLQAPNFVGKTSVLEALQYCITGDYPQNKSTAKSFWIAEDNSLTTLTLFFKDEGLSYKLIRSITRKKTRGTIENELYRVKADGSLLKIAQGNQVNSKMHEIFQWRDLTLHRFIFMDEFIVERMNERTKKLDELLKSILLPQKIKNYRKKLDKQLDHHEKQATTLEKQWVETQFKLKKSTKGKEELKTELHQLKKDLNSLNKQLDKKNKRYKTVQDKLKTKQKYVKASQKQHKIWTEYQVQTHQAFLELEQQLEDKVKTAQDDIKELRHDIDVLKGMKQVIEQFLTNIEQGQTTCPVCKNKISDCETTKHQLQTSIEKGRQSIEQKEMKLPQLEHKLTKQKKRLRKYLSDQQTEKSQLQTIETLKKKFDPETDYKDKLKTETEIIKKLKTEKSELQEQISTVKGHLKFFQEKAADIKDLKQQAIEHWTQFHLTNLTLKALQDTESDYIKELFHSIKQTIEHHWKVFQTDAIEVMLTSSKGFKPAINRGQTIEIMELSGSEKMIFIILIALTLNNKIFEYPFQCIDEPLERLDQKNRQKFSQLLEQLVAPDKQLICTAVDNWHGDTGHIIDLQEVIQPKLPGGASE